MPGRTGDGEPNAEAMNIRNGKSQRGARRTSFIPLAAFMAVARTSRPMTNSAIAVG